jgi:hypothetical protein
MSNYFYSLLTLATYGLHDNLTVEQYNDYVVFLCDLQDEENQ